MFEARTWEITSSLSMDRFFDEPDRSKAGIQSGVHDVLRVGEFSV
jgi:hypothetical protein